MSVKDIEDLLSIILAASKDEVYLNNLEKLQNAFHELIISEAAARRTKTESIICAMSKLDIELIKFKREYNRIAKHLTPEAKNAIDNYLKIIENKKSELIYEKNRLKLRR